MEETSDIVKAIESLRSDFNEFRQDLKDYLFLSKGFGEYSGQIPRTDSDRKIEAQVQSAFYQKIFDDWNTGNLETLGVIELDPSGPGLLVHKNHPVIFRLIGCAETQIVTRGELVNGTHYKFERESFKENCEALRTNHLVETHKFYPGLAKPVEDMGCE
jgi:hypothetical protein